MQLLSPAACSAIQQLECPVPAPLNIPKGQVGMVAGDVVLISSCLLYVIYCPSPPRRCNDVNLRELVHCASHSAISSSLPECRRSWIPLPAQAWLSSTGQQATEAASATLSAPVRTGSLSSQRDGSRPLCARSPPRLFLLKFFSFSVLLKTKRSADRTIGPIWQ